MTFDTPTDVPGRGTSVRTISPMVTVDDPARAALLEAAHHVLATGGPGALTVRRIASTAGMSTMNLYSRFGGKDGVVVELFTDGFVRLRAAMVDVEPSDDPIADLRRCGRAYRDFALGNPTYYAVMFQRSIPDFEPSDAAHEVATGTLGVLAERLERAMAAGDLAPADPFTTAASVWATCHGLVSLELAGAAPGGIDWRPIYDDTLDALMEGLARRRPAAGSRRLRTGTPSE
jgi:AcrR family transcriptional regulator